MKIRKLTRGIEIFGKYRFFFTKKNWKAKPHPYWFCTKYGDGSFTFQTMRFEFWKRP